MKKKSVGIIAEYNPFHNGHLYHLNQSKKLSGAEVSVVAMSGNFLQRGQIAIADKWSRAEAAVRCGADLVVEIPVVFACNSAPVFAKAGVEILEALGVDYISFGSESGNIHELMDIVKLLNEKEQEMEVSIRDSVKKGLSYPRARSDALIQMIGREKARIIDTSNNILALGYLKNIKKATPITVKRSGPGYNDLEASEEFASATAIRYMMEENIEISAFMPPESIDTVRKCLKPSKDVIFRMICQQGLIKNAENLDAVSAGGEGLGNKLKNNIRYVNSLDELVESMKSKRYTRTRIERFLTHCLLEIEDIRYENYIRILAFNKKGSAYLKNIKKNETLALPIITNINKEAKSLLNIQRTLQKDILASDIYNMASGRDLYAFSDYVIKPFTL